MRYCRCVRPFWLYIWLLLYWYLMYCIFLLYYTLNNLSLLCQGAASPFLRILLSYHSFHQSHLTPDLSKYLSAYPLNPILIPTRVALEVPIWTARAPIRLTLVSSLSLLLFRAWKRGLWVTFPRQLFYTRFGFNHRSQTAAWRVAVLARAALNL